LLPILVASLCAISVFARFARSFNLIAPFPHLLFAVRCSLRTQDGVSALHFAARSGHLPTVQVCLFALASGGRRFRIEAAAFTFCCCSRPFCPAVLIRVLAGAQWLVEECKIDVMTKSSKVCYSLFAWRLHRDVFDACLGCIARSGCVTPNRSASLVCSTQLRHVGSPLFSASILNSLATLTFENGF
jgi:hypothetical protein